MNLLRRIKEFFNNIEWKRIEKRFSKIKSGYEIYEFYSLTAKFILPRLKEYKRRADEMIIYNKGVDEKLNNAIKAFEMIVEHDDLPVDRISDTKELFAYSEKWYKEVEEGLHAFADIYFSLWL